MLKKIIINFRNFTLIKKTQGSTWSLWTYIPTSSTNVNSKWFNDPASTLQSTYQNQYKHILPLCLQKLKDRIQSSSFSHLSETLLGSIKLYYNLTGFIVADNSLLANDDIKPANSIMWAIKWYVLEANYELLEKLLYNAYTLGSNDTCKYVFSFCSWWYNKNRHSYTHQHVLKY